ncbi:MAG: hypothetical protein ABMB14_02970 [Myxococcota bacterium]
MGLGITVALPGGGCGPDLARLETEQASLEQQVSVLAKDVEEMRTQMQLMGMLPGGPAAAAQTTGGDDLASQIDVRAERQGAIPELGALAEPERRESTDCGYRFYVPWLESISDQQLEQTGSGRASPVLLRQNGKELASHAAPAAYEKGCRFSFRHQPKYLFFSPLDTVDNIAGDWTIALSPEVPLARGDDREMYWVYPGTTLTFTFSSGWDAEKWGEMKVDLDARLLYTGTAAEPAPRPGASATVSFLGVEESGEDNRLGFSRTPEPPDGAWTLDITSPSDGPFVLVETLTIGNDDHSVVVTAPTGGAE